MGGRLRNLLMYDVVCFVISFVVVYAVHISHAGPYKNSDLRPAIYWCRVLYALFALPFSFFVLPVFFNLLTHCLYTGYNRNGACVEFAYRVQQSSKTESHAE